MQHTQELKLDVAGSNKYSCVWAKQGDDASRYLKITVTEGGEALVLPTTATATFRALKPDGKSIYNPATINEDGTVTVELTAQTLAVAGRVMADVSIEDSGAVLSAVSFFIDCQPAPLGQHIDSESQMVLLEAALEKTDAAVTAEASREAAEKARAEAEAQRVAAESARENVFEEAVTNCEDATESLLSAAKYVVFAYDKTENGLKCTIYKEES